jgi:4a-hydroxytetrahydrobiopterin dehydratase
MSLNTANELAQKRCTPCEGGVPPLSAEEAKALIGQIPGWEFSQEGRRIRRRWTAKNFMAAIDFFSKVAELAEKEGHHPDLHLEGYRHVTVELWTHAIRGLAENDFILAAKIDRVPFAAKP